MAETVLPSDVIGLARIMPRGDVAVVAAPYGARDAHVAEILVAIGDSVARSETLAWLDTAAALEGAVLQAEANLAVRHATLMQTHRALEASRAEAQASLDQARANAAEAAASFGSPQSIPRLIRPACIMERIDAQFHISKRCPADRTDRQS
jgi:HlyD family secretion protein